MYCKFCGKTMEDHLLVCPACGAEQNDPTLPPVGLRRGQFYRKHFRCRRSLRLAGILCYVCAVLDLLIGVEQGLGLWSLIDVAVLLLLGGLMHLFRVRLAAILLLLYGGLCLLTVYMGGFSALPVVVTALVFAAAVLGIRGTFCFAKDWTRYCERCGKVHAPEQHEQA